MDADTEPLGNLDKVAGRPLLLCGHPKSGTSLLLSLFDGHPEMVALPSETKYFRAIHGRRELQSAEALLARTRIGRLSRNRAETLEGGPDFSNIDAARFERELAALLEPARAPNELLPAVVLAYAAATGRAPGRYWVEKTPLHEHDLETALELWPDLAAIYLVRDARDVHTSFLAKRRQRGKRLSVVTSALRIRASIAAWRRFAERYPERCLSVRYEELVREPEKVTRTITEFLGIEWREEILRPTLAGRPWGGNSMFAGSYYQISSSSIGRYITTLSPIQIRTLEILLSREFSHYDWPR